MEFVKNFFNSEFAFVGVFVFVITFDLASSIFLLEGGAKDGHIYYENNPFFKDAIEAGDVRAVVIYPIATTLIFLGQLYFWQSHWLIRSAFWFLVFLRVLMIYSNISFVFGAL